MSIGKVIKKLRTHHYPYYTQMELAKKINISQTSLSQIECNNKNPHRSTLKKIAKAFGTHEIYIHFLAFKTKGLSDEKIALYNGANELLKLLFKKK